MDIQKKIRRLENCIIFEVTPQGTDVSPSVFARVAKEAPKGAVMDFDLARIWGAFVVAGLPADIELLRVHPETEARRDQILKSLPRTLSAQEKEWIVRGNVGLSSALIMYKMSGYYPYPTGRMNLEASPSDLSDFKRCALLVEAVPGYRRRLAVMNSVSLVWQKLVASWDEIIAALDDECPNWRSNLRPSPFAESIFRETITLMRAPSSPEPGCS